MTHKLIPTYKKLFDRFGEQHWWPGDTPFEVVIGAILTQSTSWRNVEKAIDNLKKEMLLSPQGINRTKVDELSELIRPAGYYNAKARKLKEFTSHLEEGYQNDLDKLLSKDVDTLREELLSIWGIGPETADSIILYAATKPSFVVDAYTKRIFHRLGYVKEDVSYDELKEYSEKNLPKDTYIYNEFHALIVRLGKEHCKKTRPLCAGCPLKRGCAHTKKDR